MIRRLEELLNRRRRLHVDAAHDPLLPASRLHALELLIKLSTTRARSRRTQTSSGTRREWSQPTQPRAAMKPPVRKNYLLPAVEIPAFLLLLNGYDRIAFPNTYYNSGPSIREYFSFTICSPAIRSPGQGQFAEEAQSLATLCRAMMYGFRRSAGLELLGEARHANVGSYIWMITGETDNPDQRPGHDRQRRGRLRRGAVPDGKPRARTRQRARREARRLVGPTWAADRRSARSTGLNTGPVRRPLQVDAGSRDPATFTRLRVVNPAPRRFPTTGPDTNGVFPNALTPTSSMDYGTPRQGRISATSVRSTTSISRSPASTTCHDAIENVMTRVLRPRQRNTSPAGDGYCGVWGLYGRLRLHVARGLSVSEHRGSHRHDGSIVAVQGQRPAGHRPGRSRGSARREIREEETATIVTANAARAPWPCA